MWYEIFKFEIRYRLKRPETYLFFFLLALVSIFGVDFVFEGIELGLVKKNAPIVIAKTMGAYTGIFMILASMIMGMPILRDDHYQLTSLMYTAPITKWDILVGRYWGSFLILFVVFTGIPIGMMIGEMMPWHLKSEMGQFRLTSYLNSFSILLLPTLFFGGSLFFVTGALSRNLFVVYTQGVVLFVWFLLTKSISNEYLQAVLDPFSLTTTTYLSKSWSVTDRNTLLMPLVGVLLANKLFWIAMGIIALGYGYWKFDFSQKINSKKSKGKEIMPPVLSVLSNVAIPMVDPDYGLRSKLNQWISMSRFYAKTLLKETSFWAIIACAVIIIVINSVNLGTVYGVDSYPTTYFIIAELQEMSMYFFVIILLFYSGELYWSERSVRLQQMTDATPVSTFVNICSKTTGLIVIYVVLMLILICSGVLFQLFKGYYHFDLPIYFSGFFIEILPILSLYTIAAFFIQSLVHNKFLGILITILFMIGTAAMQVLNPADVLINFAGGALAPYSEMNGYGHFMTPYLWTKLYWGLIGILFLIAASIIAVRGTEMKIICRLKISRKNISKVTGRLGSMIVVLILMLGGYIFSQTYISQEVWTEEEEWIYRANYEKFLKQYEYWPQPHITDVNLLLELYPESRSYDVLGEYTLKNTDTVAIAEIHLQKLIQLDVRLDSIHFSAPVTIDSQYVDYNYFICRLEEPLLPDESIQVKFHQSVIPQGWDMSGDIGAVVHNGTFIRNNELPTIGYNRKYELRDSLERLQNGLQKRVDTAPIDDVRELCLARTGSDAQGVNVHTIIGTSVDQIGVTSGSLINQWTQDERNYFEYKTDEPIIDFYAMLSGRYEVHRDIWMPTNSNTQDVVNLEIYFHPRHGYNLDRMMGGMKSSLDYLTTHISPYQYEQLRIIEFPRYEDFAQSFPNMIPFSESMGFMLDIDDEVDMAFFITAHEVAHQWWGMQVETANVQGRNFVLETLSQYAALMIFKQQYSKERIDQFLDLQQELYDEGKRKAAQPEVPLYIVEGEEYIYYNKGALVMYELQELIGEERVNNALRSLVRDWNSKDGHLKKETDRYVTSQDLIGYLLAVADEEDKSKVRELLMEVK